MAAIEEHKPVEKRRALGRGLESLLPSGPRVVAAAPTTAVAPVVIPAAVAPVIAEPGPELVPMPGEIGEIHAARERAPLKPKPGLNGPPVRQQGPRLTAGRPSEESEFMVFGPAPERGKE